MTEITDSDAPATMLAAQLSESGSIGNLRIVELPMPVPPDGWVRLKVMDGLRPQPQRVPFRSRPG